MFAGSLANSKSDKKALPQAIVRGLEYLEQNDIAGMEPGRYDIDGDDLFVLVQDYTTVSPNEKRPEAHDKYLDIQYIASGKEVIGWGVRGGDVTVAEDLLAEKDIVFFKTVKNETALILEPGMYAVFFPNDIHRPGCLFSEPAAVRKAVVKIKMGEL
ncbi:MAG: YhcH/YjgK/YiaL family protein [Spirochaetales bacterium]|nr:YhcH/YjgK/YiaL family protein [Spirochaetales bacterium]